MNSQMTLDEQIADVLAQIHAAAKKGDQAKLRRIIRDLIEPTLDLDPAELHRQRLEAIGTDTVALCAYFGELGLSLREVEQQLGRAATDEEQQAMKTGRAKRLVEVRAIELETARRSGKVLPWMQR